MAGAKPKRLKVYRTAIGFHDAYVAAPSKKAALAAWGASKDLFAIGAAELVTDPELTKAPLAAPGEVVRRSRGSLAEQLAALPENRTKAEPAPAARVARPKPPPSRKALDAAQAALKAFEDEAAGELAGLREREEAMRREREALESRQHAAARKLEDKAGRARQRYDDALARWRQE